MSVLPSAHTVLLPVSPPLSCFFRLAVARSYGERNREPESEDAAGSPDPAPNPSSTARYTRVHTALPNCEISHPSNPRTTVYSWLSSPRQSTLFSTPTCNTHPCKFANKISRRFADSRVRWFRPMPPLPVAFVYVLRLTFE